MTLRSEGSAKGKWIKVVEPVHLSQGYNDIALLSETVGLQVIGLEIVIHPFDILNAQKDK